MASLQVDKRGRSSLFALNSNKRLLESKDSRQKSSYSHSEVQTQLIQFHLLNSKTRVARAFSKGSFCELNMKTRYFHSSIFIQDELYNVEFALAPCS